MSSSRGDLAIIIGLPREEGMGICEERGSQSLERAAAEYRPPRPVSCRLVAAGRIAPCVCSCRNMNMEAWGCQRPSRIELRCDRLAASFVSFAVSDLLMNVQLADHGI